MFSLQQIQQAHDQVKTGAHFPKYIHDLKNLGVLSFRFQVLDGIELYQGKDGFEQQTEAKYEALNLVQEVDLASFSKELIDHQQGKTDFPHFIKVCADTGVNYWIVDLVELTCTYYDAFDEIILSEDILMDSI